MRDVPAHVHCDEDDIPPGKRCRQHWNAHIAASFATVRVTRSDESTRLSGQYFVLWIIS